MVPNLLFYQLLLSTLVLICLMIHVWWPNNPRVTPHKPRKPATPRRKRSEDPHPFPGLIHKPLGEACEQGADPRPKAPGAPPPVMVFTQGRRRTIDPQQHGCPEPDLWVLACLAEGLSIRGTARGFEIDPKTVLSWLVDAAEQLPPFQPTFCTDYTFIRFHSTNSTPS
jgi:hypothetical protein